MSSKPSGEQTMLYVDGHRWAYSHTCGSNVFTRYKPSDPEANPIRKYVSKSVPYVYRCNGCGEFVWEDTEEARANTD